MSETPDISALVPCLNEAENVEAIAEAIANELTTAQVSYEIVFIDNGSTDGTIDLIKALCARDERVRLIVNNQNYGQMRSPTYGIYQTSGRAVIGISADFQDPPELIGDFIFRWRAGAQIVLGVRRSEDAPLTLRVLRALGYGFFERFGDYRVIPGATGFGLYDRIVVDCLKQWRDPEPFFRGMLVESGFSLETIRYDRPPRAGGQTKNNLATLLNFAVSGVTSSSKKLLRIPLYIALVLSFLTGATLIAGLVSVILGRQGWAYGVAAGFELAFALVFLFLGLIGEQVRFIAQIVRNAPLVVERERVNFPQRNL
jgi:glycosyltransferase involved in cell wall biosynthesis